MKFPVTSMTVLCVLLDLSDSIVTDQDLEERFKGRTVQAEEIIIRHAEQSLLVFPLVQRVESHLHSVCEVVCLREEVMAMCAEDRVQQIGGAVRGELAADNYSLGASEILPLTAYYTSRLSAKGLETSFAPVRVDEVVPKPLDSRIKVSDAEWENVWHNERHTRCRANLLKHLYWACEKDIYRLSRRNDQHSHVVLSPYPPGSPFVSVVEARVFLRSRRDRKRRSAAGGSITDECCQASGGCTWEEYAEYCPANKRLRKFL
uniref:Insulin-like peptide 7 n=1 Tax=Timema cristinae TaxID=61476 RepID=A0A7R9H055_TIMCR|nr:unnamed protein product [Timema cristinae]